MSSTIYLRKTKDLENTLSKEYICSEVLKFQKQIEQLKKDRAYVDEQKKKTYKLSEKN